MAELARLSNLVSYLPAYGSGALAVALQSKELPMREATLDDLEAMHPGLFGAN